MRITLNGLKNIPLAEEVQIEANVDYMVPVIFSRESVEVFDSHGEENEDRTIKVKVVRIADIQKVGTSQTIKVIQGKTASQRLRAAIFSLLQRRGDPQVEEEYEKEMDKIIAEINEKNV